MATQAIFARSRTGFARWETTSAKMEEPAYIVVHIRLAIANQDLKVCKNFLKSNGGGFLKDRSFEHTVFRAPNGIFVPNVSLSKNRLPNFKDLLKRFLGSTVWTQYVETMYIYKFNQVLVLVSFSV